MSSHPLHVAGRERCPGPSGPPRDRSRRLDAHSGAVFGEILAASLLYLSSKHYTSLNTAQKKGKIDELSNACCPPTDKAMLLSQLAGYNERLGDVEGAALLAYVAPVAWQHSNFYGHDEFRTTPAVIDLEEFVRL